MAALPADIGGPSDAELIESVRGGQIDAYGSLYERHVTAAHNLARQLSRSRAEADDLVSEAFARVLDTLRAGRGPDSAFRAYLLTALRHVAYDKTRKDRRLELAEDVTEVSGVNTEQVSVPFRDTAVAGLERSLAAKAFARLPERWQAVLWHTEIEGQSPAEVAPLLGLTANGVSALAYRAREGLRQAYLQVHLAENTADRCRATVARLGAWTRDGLSKRETAQVEAHLDECDRCRALAAELADVNGALKAFVAPLVLGAGALGYLALSAAGAKTAAATTAGITAGVTAGATAGSSAAGAAGAAGAASSVPRQFVGVGLSVAALAAAIAIALTGNSNTQVNAVAPPPQPIPHSRPAAPAPPPASPAAPAPASPAAPPPAIPAPSSPAPAPAPAPAPGQPRLSASGPSGSITLVPGQGAVDLPITASNTGNATSAPVTAQLNLPAGVTALGPGQQPPAQQPSTQFRPAVGTGPAAGTAPSATNSQPIEHTAPSDFTASSQLPQVDCPGGSGTVSCMSPTGLPPGQSVTLMFRLVAAAGSAGGQITGTVSANGTMSVQVTVRVQVPPPAPVDAITLSARQDPTPNQSWWWLEPWDSYPLLEITVTNVGDTSKPVTVSLDRPGTLVLADPATRCTGERDGTQCTTAGNLDPRHRLHLLLRLYHLRADRDTVTVTAALGSAQGSTTVALTGWCWPNPWPWPLPSPIAGPDTRTPSPTTTTPSTPDTTTTRPPTSTTKPPSSPVPILPTIVEPPTGTTAPQPTPTPSPPSSVQPEPSSPDCPTLLPIGPGRLRPGTGPAPSLCVPLLGPL